MQGNVLIFDPLLQLQKILCGVCVKGSLIPLAWALLKHLSEMVLPVDGHCLLRPAPIKQVSHPA